jgi:hypothetical protein
MTIDLGLAARYSQNHSSRARSKVEIEMSIEERATGSIRGAVMPIRPPRTSRRNESSLMPRLLAIAIVGVVVIIVLLWADSHL